MRNKRETTILTIQVAMARKKSRASIQRDNTHNGRLKDGATIVTNINNNNRQNYLTEPLKKRELQ